MGRRAVDHPIPLRSQIWLAHVGLDEPKRFVVVSNNDRNERLRDVLGVRMTTASKPAIGSVVEFRAGEVSRERCYAVADDIWPIPKGNLVRQMGALSLSQMNRVEDAMRVALALR